MISVLLALLLFAVLQVAVLFYVRNIVAASAANGARYAATSNTEPTEGGRHASAQISTALSGSVGRDVPCTGRIGIDGGSGVSTTIVQCEGSIKSIFLPLGAFGSYPGHRPCANRTRVMRLTLARDDSGSAVIEFIFVAVIVMVPLIYLIVSVAQIERSSLAVGQAAREAGRAFATADSTADALRRADVAARLALEDQGLQETPQLSFHTGPGCSSATVQPVLRAGAQYTICVSRTADLIGVPSILAGRGVQTTGEFVLHVDDFRGVQ